LDFIIHSILNASPFFVYILVALILLLESTAVPVANTTLLLLTGALASLGHLNIYVLAIAAILGSITGACLAYLLGIKGGRQVLLRLASRFRVDPQKISIAENWFQGAGVWMVFLSRIIPYVRPFASLPCGISRMPFRRFLLAALCGSIVWCIGILSNWLGTWSSLPSRSSPRAIIYHSCGLWADLAHCYFPTHTIQGQSLYSLQTFVYCCLSGDPGTAR